MKRDELKLETKVLLERVFKGKVEEGKITGVMTEEVLKGIEDIIKSVQELKDENESVKFANATFGCKEVKGRSGVTKLPNKPEVAWTTEDHMEGSVKASTPMKKMFE